VGFLDGWRFCPRCGAEGAPAANNFACGDCGHVVWANSVPAVQALVERDGKLLLARRAFEPRAGYWDVPGGFMEEGEGPLAALHRELREETGLELEQADFFGIWTEPDYDGRSVLSLTWRARLQPGEPVAADDVAAFGWFGPDELPADEELAFTHFPELLRLWRQQHP
jgi:ADP-ribose pyrophosphatase YjhB (NUDIX family)